MQSPLRTLCGCWQYLDGNGVGLLDYGYGKEFIFVWGHCVLCGLWLWVFLKGITRPIKQEAFEWVMACCMRMFTDTVHIFVFFSPRIDSLHMFRKPDRDWVAITRLSKMPDNHCLSPDTCLLGAYASFLFRILEHRSSTKKWQ